jgi:predicted NUDIX family NTP pyrophosphohydrolase
MPQISAGLLLYRRREPSSGLRPPSPGGRGETIEVFLAHPGGPFWKNKDDGAWTIPKGLADEGEDLLAAACREFEEETGICPREPLLPLGSIQQKAGKMVHAWAWQGDADPAAIQSNMTQVEMPRGSGRWVAVPEIDRCAWFDLGMAAVKINPAQAAFLERLKTALQASS